MLMCNTKVRYDGLNTRCVWVMDKLLNEDTLVRCNYSSITKYQPLLKLGHEWVIISQRNLWDVRTYPCLNIRAPSQYKDRLIYVWRFPC